MELKFCANLNKILEVIRFLVMTVFLCHLVFACLSSKAIVLLWLRFGINDSVTSCAVWR